MLWRQMGKSESPLSLTRPPKDVIQEKVPNKSIVIKKKSRLTVKERATLELTTLKSPTPEKYVDEPTTATLLWQKRVKKALDKEKLKLEEDEV